MPAISVIVPTFNCADTINKTLTSICRQQLSDIEIIICDDNSNDNTVEILKEFQSKDPRIRIYENTTNKGAGERRNFGLNKANGNYVIFLDGDDFFEPNLLSSLYIAALNSDSEITLCNFIEERQNNQIIHRQDCTLIKDGTITLEKHKNNLFQYIEPIVWNKLYKKDFLKKNNLKFAETRQNNDLKFVYESVLKAEKIAKISQELIAYNYTNPKSISNKADLTQVFNSFDPIYKSIILNSNPTIYISSLLKRIQNSLLYYILKKNVDTRISSEKLNGNKIYQDWKKLKQQFNEETYIIDKILNNCPLISIIVPVYNTSKYLVHNIESLMSQSFKDIEVIYVNDGSTDNSSELLHKNCYKYKNIKIIDQQNRGPGAARNQGLSNSSGAFIMFCDSDDTYTEHMCKEMLIQMWLHYYQIEFVECDSQIVMMTDNSKRSQGSIDYHHIKYSGFKPLNYQSKRGIKVLLWNKIFKKYLIDKYQITFVENFKHDDSSFIWQYLAVSNCCYGILKKLYNYSIRENSIMEVTSDPITKDQEILTVIDVILFVYKKINDYLSKNKLSFFYYISADQINYWSTMVNNKDAFERKARELYIELIPEQFKNLFNLESKSSNLENLQNVKTNKVFYIKRSLNSVKYKFLNLSLLKIKKKNQKYYIYLLGIRILSFTL